MIKNLSTDFIPTKHNPPSLTLPYLTLQKSLWALGFGVKKLCVTYLNNQNIH